LPAVDFSWQETLPTWADTPSPFCVACGTHSCGQAFINFISDVEVRSPGGAVLDYTAGYMCWKCTKAMVHTLPGIVPGSEVAKARRQAEKLAVESEKLRAEAEAWQRVDEFFAQFKL